jgi:hypothetical protein
MEYYSSESMRGESELDMNSENQDQLASIRITQRNGAYGIGESWSLLFPNAKGGGSGVYWGRK